MSIISKRLRVTASSHSQGWGKTQYLRSDTLFMGIIIYTEIIDTEEVPGHVVIEAGALGHTFWKSKWQGMPGIFWKTHGGYVQYEQGNV
jgi:hypothetical protein